MQANIFFSFMFSTSYIFLLCWDIRLLWHPRSSIGVHRCVPMYLPMDEKPSHDLLHSVWGKLWQISYWKRQSSNDSPPKFYLTNQYISHPIDFPCTPPIDFLMDFSNPRNSPRKMPDNFAQYKFKIMQLTLDKLQFILLCVHFGTCQVLVDNVTAINYANMTYWQCYIHMF